MTRAERAAEAARLSGEGLNGIEIAARLGISRSYAYGLLNDPTGDADRERKRSYGRPCIEGCGRVTGGHDGRANAPLRCLECERHRNDERNARIFAAWEAGDTAGEIAAREGMTETQVGSLIDYHRRRRREPIQLPLHRRRNRELWPLIERRWLEGATTGEIAAEVGVQPSNISFAIQLMRKAGIDLPHRRKAA